MALRKSADGSVRKREGGHPTSRQNFQPPSQDIARWKMVAFFSDQ
jgi:hypothetical protein